MKQLYLIYVAVYIIASVLTAQPLHVKSNHRNQESNINVKPELLQNQKSIRNTNDIGKITQEVWQKWSEPTSQYENSAQYLYTYDTITNNLVEYIYQIWDGIQWINDHLYNYIYGNTGLLTQYEYHEWNGKKWKHIGTGDCSNYDINGNYGEESYSEKKQGNFEYKDRYIYTYDSNNNIIEYFSYYFEDPDWLNFDRYLYEFIGNCRTNSTEYIWDGTQYALASQIVFNYDSGCSEPIPHADFWWLYDGSPTSWTYSIWNGTEWLPSLYGEYVVNNCGWTTDGILYKDYDSTTMTWTKVSANGHINYNQNCSNPAPNSDDVRVISAEYQENDNGSMVNSERTLISYEGYQLGVLNTDSMIDDFILEQNFPNPFNPNTKISFSIFENTNVELLIYNVRGELINLLIDDNLEANSYNLVWNGKDDLGHQVGAGIYFYSLKTDNNIQTKKMVLVK